MKKQNQIANDQALGSFLFEKCIRLSCEPFSPNVLAQTLSQVTQGIPVPAGFTQPLLAAHAHP